MLTASGIKLLLQYNTNSLSMSLYWLLRKRAFCQTVFFFSLYTRLMSFFSTCKSCLEDCLPSPEFVFLTFIPQYVLWTSEWLKSPGFLRWPCWTVIHKALDRGLSFVWGCQGYYLIYKAWFFLPLFYCRQGIIRFQFWMWAWSTNSRLALFWQRG